jgi:hypothetical protein
MLFQYVHLIAFEFLQHLRKFRATFQLVLYNFKKHPQDDLMYSTNDTTEIFHFYRLHNDPGGSLFIPLITQYSELS